MPARPGSVPAGLLEVGRIGRPHGVRGDLYVDLVTDREERLAVGSRLFADRWITVESARRLPQRWLVHFEGVDERTAAERLTNTALHAEPIDDPDAIWVHEIIGAPVVDAAGVDRGVCVAVLHNPASDLLELSTGALVPVDFLVEMRDGVVVVDPPAGLFEVYEQ